MGKVNLLISQKFAQFRGLCEECIEAASTEFVTLPSDLEGFWAMVMLQVDDVRSMIAGVDALRRNGWQLIEEPVNGNTAAKSSPGSQQNGNHAPAVTVSCLNI